MAKYVCLKIFVFILQGKFDPRTRFMHEEPKPNHSYIGLIAMAILSSKEKKLVLSDIYQWILDSYAYFRQRGPGWRNSIRHNLSLNDCFIKVSDHYNRFSLIPPCPTSTQKTVDLWGIGGEKGS